MSTARRFSWRLVLLYALATVFGVAGWASTARSHPQLSLDGLTRHSVSVGLSPASADVGATTSIAVSLDNGGVPLSSADLIFAVPAGLRITAIQSDSPSCQTNLATLALDCRFQENTGMAQITQLGRLTVSAAAPGSYALSLGSGSTVYGTDQTRQNLLRRYPISLLVRPS